MTTQIPKEVYAYGVSFLNNPLQIIPTVPPVVGNANNTINYLIKIKDDNPLTVIKALILGTVPAVSIGPTKIVTTSDGTNNYVYVGGSSTTGGIYRVINDSSPNTIPYISAASTNGIFDVDETNKKLCYVNDAGTSVTIRDISVAPVADITITTPYISITEIKISPDGKKLLVAGRALVATIDTPIIDIYTKDSLGDWQLANRLTYTPNVGSTNIVTEIAINKVSTFAYAVSPVGALVSSIQLTGSFGKTDKLLMGYVPNSIQLKGTELYVADSSVARILKLNAVDLSLLKIIESPYSPDIRPNKLALTSYEDTLFVSPFQATDSFGGIRQWRIDVIEPVTGIDSRKSTYDVGLYNQSPIATFTILSDNDTSSTVPLLDNGLQDLNEAVCIITTKVFSSCKEKDCLVDVPTSTLLGTAPYVLNKISFGKGEIANKSITFINDGNNLSRVEFDVSAPYIINYTANGMPQTLTGILFLGHKDILMYIPQTANMNAEDYKLIVETYTNILDGPKVVNNTFVFTVGVYEVFKIIEDVQLFIPAFGYCPVPTDSTPFTPSQPIGICDIFMNDMTFPEDFFPFQYGHFKH
jgi:hypothetical protein